MRGDGFKKYETNFFPKNHPPIRGDEGGWFLGVTDSIHCIGNSSISSVEYL